MMRFEKVVKETSVTAFDEFSRCCDVYVRVLL